MLAERLHICQGLGGLLRPIGRGGRQAQLGAILEMKWQLGDGPRGQSCCRDQSTTHEALTRGKSETGSST